MSKSEEQKRLLIEQLKKTPIVQLACEKIGVARSTYYRWKKQNKTFAKEAEEAILAGELLINDMAEAQLLSAIRDKNLTAIIFWLKHHHHRYATRVEVTAQLKRTPEELTPEQEAVVMKALGMATLIPPVIAEESEEQEIEITTEKESA
ncbi:MAG TPA: phBC6A51 family helix-turn-helix protein [Candidatus Woesebacteria bacterium]|nr:phBC6A51 family helix-turn-helix protein [Candidatus Woesebacteria bacterium]